MDAVCRDVMTSSPGQVHVIDDDADLRQSMEGLLRFVGYEVSIWPHARAYLDATPVHVLPTVIVTDMRMPELSGLELHEALLESGQAVPVVYISGESSLQQSIAAMKLGPVDFLLKPFTAQELLDSVAKGMDRARQMRQRRCALKDLEEKLARLSPRERQVYELLCKGFNNAEIMAVMGISLPTAKQYKTTVMRQLAVGSMAQLLAMAQAAEPGQRLAYDLPMDKS